MTRIIFRNTGGIISTDYGCLHQGTAGLTARDIKLFVDAGYYTVESVAYTYVDRDAPISIVSYR